jgi:hypothetical protein
MSTPFISFLAFFSVLSSVTMGRRQAIPYFPQVENGVLPLLISGSWLRYTLFAIFNGTLAKSIFNFRKTGIVLPPAA